MTEWKDIYAVVSAAWRIDDPNEFRDGGRLKLVVPPSRNLRS